MADTTPKTFKDIAVQEKLSDLEIIREMQSVLLSDINRKAEKAIFNFLEDTIEQFNLAGPDYEVRQV